jgi:hypothetical protein
MIVVLLEEHADEFSLRQEAASELARLGVTGVALARDEQTVAVVLEGWLFDPLAASPAVTNTIAHRTRRPRPAPRQATGDLR